MDDALNTPEDAVLDELAQGFTATRAEGTEDRRVPRFNEPSRVIHAPHIAAGERPDAIVGGMNIEIKTMPGQPDPSTLDTQGDRIQQPLSRTHAFSAAVMNLDVEGYGSLARVLRLAFEQSAEGKGKERHANAKPFLRQPILENGRVFGDGFTSGQAVKKLQELHGMIERGQFSAAKREALGAIVYTAATYLLIEELEEAANTA